LFKSLSVSMLIPILALATNTTNKLEILNNNETRRSSTLTCTSHVRLPVRSTFSELSVFIPMLFCRYSTMPYFVFVIQQGRTSRHSLGGLRFQGTLSPTLMLNIPEQERGNYSRKVSSRPSQPTKSIVCGPPPISGSSVSTNHHRPSHL